MDFPLQVIFYGLVAFAPTGQQPGQPYLALLPQTTGGQYASDGCHLREHKPMMVIAAASCTLAGHPCQTVGSSPDTPDQVRQHVLNTLFFLPLQDRDLTVDLPAATPARPPNRHGHLPASADEAKDPYWLLSYPGKNRVNPDCLSTDPLLDHTCPITARVTLQRAAPETCHLIESGNQVCAYRFRSFHEWWPFNDRVQAIADGTAFHYKAAASPVTLNLVTLWSGDRSDLVLTPEPPTAADPGGIKIWIAEMVVDTDVHETDICAAGVSEGRHFEVYYNLLARDENGKPMGLDKRPAPADEKECQSTAAIQVSDPCPDVPSPPAPPPPPLAAGLTRAHIIHMTDLSACGHVGQTMFSP